MSNLKHLLSNRVSESQEPGSGSGPYSCSSCGQGLWSSEGLLELEDLLPRRRLTGCWQEASVCPCCWQKASVSCHLELSIGLPYSSQDVAAGCSQSRWFKRKGGKKAGSCRYLLWSSLQSCTPSLPLYSVHYSELLSPANTREEEN